MENIINEDIRASRVTLIDDAGKSLGDVSKAEALSMAKEKGLDLVMISGSNEKPVCKILDYGKFLYQKKKRQKKNVSSQHSVKLKEIKIRPVTSSHDCGIKAEQARGFLKEGDKVKLMVVFRGREKGHLDIVKQKCLEFTQLVSDVAVEESPPQFSWAGDGGRENCMNVILVKKK